MKKHFWPACYRSKANKNFRCSLHLFIGDVLRPNSEQHALDNRVPFEDVVVIQKHSAGPDIWWYAVAEMNGIKMCDYFVDDIVHKAYTWKTVSHLSREELLTHQNLNIRNLINSPYYMDL